MKSIFKQIVKKLISRKVQHFPHYQEHFSNLRNEISSLQTLNLPSDTDSTDREWLRNRIEIRSKLLNEEPFNFLEWEVIKFTMFTQYPAKYLKDELCELKREHDYKNYWKPALIEQDLGAPIRYPYFLESSGQLIHHAYHLLKLKQFLSVRPDEITNIFEFGGGYGNLAKLSFNLGFVGTYFIYDLPEFSALQRFYLNCLNFNEHIYQQHGQRSFSVLSDISYLKSIEELFHKTNGNLFIATWSFSESPLELRRKFIPLIKNCSFILIAFLQEFKEVNNLEYFKEFCQELEEFDFIQTKIPNIEGENFYLFGKVKNASKQSKNF